MAAPLPTRTTGDTPASHVLDHGALHALYNTQTSIQAKSANYSMATTDGTILASGTITVTLPPVGTAIAGVRYTVKNTGTGTITIAPASGTVDGAANISVSVQYSSLDFVTDGTNWFTV